MKTFQEKYKTKIEQYEKVFNLDDLNDANDRSNLEIMIKTEIMIDDIQEKIASLMDEDDVTKISDVKKLHDLLRDATNTITTLQKTLNIDRKTRKSEETSSVAEYIRTLLRAASGFMEERVIKAYCPNCKVMVGRIYPVHDHTAFSVSFQCSQCKKLIRARRDEKDIFWDVRDHEWRRSKRAEVVQPKVKATKKYDDLSGIDDELYLGATSELIPEDPDILEPAVVEDEIELGTKETTD